MTTNRDEKSDRRMTQRDRVVTRYRSRSGDPFCTPPGLLITRSYASPTNVRWNQ
jgi:hypothetical protein